MTIQTINRTPSQIYFEREPESDPIVEKQSLKQHRIAALSLSRKLRKEEELDRWGIIDRFGIPLEYFIGPRKEGENTPEFEQARAFLLRKEPETLDELQQWEMVEIVAWKELQILQQRIKESAELCADAYGEFFNHAHDTLLNMTRDQAYSVNASFGQFYDTKKSEQQRQIQQPISARRWFKMKEVTKIGLEYTGYAFLVILSPVWFPIFLIYAYILKIHKEKHMSMSSVSDRLDDRRTLFVESPLSEDQERLVEGFGTEKCQVGKYISENPLELFIDHPGTPATEKNEVATDIALKTGAIVGIPSAVVVGVTAVEVATVSTAAFSTVGIGLIGGGAAASGFGAPIAGALLLALAVKVGIRVYYMRDTAAFQTWKIARDQIIRDRALLDMIRVDIVLKDFLCPITGKLPLYPVRRNNGSDMEQTFDYEPLLEYVQQHPGTGYYRGEPAFQLVEYEVEGKMIKDIEGLEFDTPHLNTMIDRLGKINTKLSEITAVARHQFIQFNKKIRDQMLKVREKTTGTFAKKRTDDMIYQHEQDKKLKDEPLSYEQDMKGEKETPESFSYYNPQSLETLKSYETPCACLLYVRKKLNLNPGRRTITFLKTYKLPMKELRSRETTE